MATPERCGVVVVRSRCRSAAGSAARGCGRPRCPTSARGSRPRSCPRGRRRPTMRAGRRGSRACGRAGSGASLSRRPSWCRRRPGAEAASSSNAAGASSGQLEAQPLGQLGGQRDSRRARPRAGFGCPQPLHAALEVGDRALLLERRRQTGTIVVAQPRGVVLERGDLQHELRRAPARRASARRPASRRPGRRRAARSP